MGSGPYAIKQLKLEGEFKPRTNHHPQEPYYRLPFANDVIYLAGFFCSGLSFLEGQIDGETMVLEDFHFQNVVTPIPYTFCLRYLAMS